MSDSRTPRPFPNDTERDDLAEQIAEAAEGLTGEELRELVEAARKMVRRH
jgi:hypothetical protein